MIICAIKANRYLIGTSGPGQIMNIDCLTQGYTFGPSSESVHEVDGPSSSAVHLRPSRTNNHGLSSEFVHEVDGLSSSGRPPPSIYGKFSWSVVRIRLRDGQYIHPAVHLRPSVINYHGPSSKSVHDMDGRLVDGPTWEKYKVTVFGPNLSFFNGSK